MEKTTMTTAELLSVLALEGAIKQEFAGHLYPSDISAITALDSAIERNNEVPEYIQRLKKAVPIAMEIYEKIIGNPTVADYPSDIKEKSWGNIMNEISTGLDYILTTCSDLKAKRIVCLEMMKYFFRNGTTQLQAEGFINKCFEKGFFVKGTEGGVMVGKRRFIFSDKFGLTSDDKLDIISSIKSIIAPEKSEEKPFVPASPPKRNGTDKITASQAWKGKLGKFELHIPPSGNRKAGVLQMELQDGKILFVSEASNGLADLKTQSIALSTLKSSGKLSPDCLKIVPPNHLYGDKLEKWLNRTERLASILLCGFQAAVEGQHNINPKEFLTTNVVGDSELTFVGDFDWQPDNENDAGTFNNLSLRFRRQDDGQIALIEIVSEEAQDFPLLASAIRVYCQPGQAFNKMYPVFCRAFLRAVYKQVVMGRYEN